jgi:streptogramin lyase
VQRVLGVLNLAVKGVEMKKRVGARFTRDWFTIALGAGALAAFSAVAALSVTSASATGGPAVQMVAVPGGGTGQNAIIAGPDGTEWFAVKTGSGMTLQHATVGGTLAAGSVSPLAAPGLSAETSTIEAMVSAKGLIWAAANGGNLYALSTDGSTATKFTGTGDIRDMATGPDGNLWTTDNGNHIDKWAVAATPTATVTQNLGSDGPAAITNAGGFLVWSDELYHYPWYTSTSGTEFGPFAGSTMSTFAHSMVQIGSNLWTVAPLSTPNKINELSASPTYGLIHSYTAAAGSTITAVTAGPDGALWFTEAGASPAIGQLDPSTGTITQYPLPSGYTMPAPAGATLPPAPTFAIAPGPSGSNTVWFTAQTSGGAPAVGEITGVTTGSTGGTSPTGTSGSTGTTGSTGTSGSTGTPGMGGTTGTSGTAGPTGPTGCGYGGSCPKNGPTTAPPRFKSKAKVSKKGIASILLSCPARDTCGGSLSLSLTLAHHKHAVSFGATSFTLVGGKSKTLSVKLPGKAFKLLKAAPSDKLVVKVKLVQGSHASGGSLTLLGP